ncbi:precorrin-2 C(20)-methyltransferase [Flavonifractor sp. An92]|uniref:precorrin-2 C(20)-methyltransferase n=1 Tax=Flavonifractor sp. An92 TaxID=1965666 RepID=UPI000B389BA0|nr:precorrin-2 C(20)-methyltransferase [Flavonifractor sp. An92]OUN07328.1 precorrin-2 C(20)-methyltransferase [Flavonifractor sp. An92]
MRRGILYGVGVGPGDPELLTLKAARILREADVIAMPDKGSGEGTAEAIAGAYLAGKERLSCPTPMTRDRKVLEECYAKSADALCALLDAGKTVAFITLGDPTVYSTYIYIHRLVVERGYEAELIPGVPSFCAAAARLGVSLCQGEEKLLIVPASHNVEGWVDLPTNQIYMKAGRKLGELQALLARHGRLEDAMAVSNCGMANEEVWPHFRDMAGDEGYFTVVFSLAGEGN